MFRGSLNAAGFEGWLSKYLLPELKIPSLLIMDNAPIHRKKAIEELVELSCYAFKSVTRRGARNSCDRQHKRLIGHLLVPYSTQSKCATA